MTSLPGEDANDQWADSIMRNGLIIADALDAAQEHMEDGDDAGNALAFAIAQVVHPDGLEAFIDSLRTFSKARRSTSN